MREIEEMAPLDHGLIRPISIPPDSRIPDQATGLSTREEYDHYFRIDRGQIGLSEWSDMCLEVQRRVLVDLDDVDLSADERRDLLYGFLLLSNSALRRWISATAGPEEARKGLAS
jgi:hypothetical protein